MAAELQLDSYLARIAYRAPLAPDLATLAALQAAHVDALPFEALDPLMGRPVHVDLPSVQQKLVLSRRGGYCFEQNVLFQAVLEAIGFKVVGLTGRVRWRSAPDDPLGPRQHMMLLVEVEGRPHLVDVGFGICMMDGPIRLEVDGGITRENAAAVAAAGADTLVAGSAVFKGGSVASPAPYGANIRAIREAAEAVRQAA